MFLFILGIIFVVISIYLKKKKYERASALYWIIVIIYVFAFVSIGNFELFGSWFSLYGAGKEIVLMSYFNVLAIMSSPNILFLGR